MRPLLAAALTIAALSPVMAPAHATTTSPQLGLGFSQDGKPLAMAVSADRLTTTVALRSRPFNIHFPTAPADPPFYMLTAWTDDSIFGAIPVGVEVDADFDKFNYFSLAAVIADKEEGSGTLFLNDRGTQFFYDRRLTRSGSGYAAPFATIWQESGEMPIAEWDAPIYAVAWFDKDANGTVDPGEYEKFVFNFNGR